MPEPSRPLIVERPRGAAEAVLGRTLHPLLARILSARGVASVEELDLSMAAMLPPEDLTHAPAAAARLAEAVSAGQHIKIIGDFDADGATASALAVAALKAMGAARVTYLVPNRFEFGYGLTPEIVALALEDEPDLIVTVDNGISSIDGVRAANEAGVAVIITDHHLPGSELPAAEVIVNPNQPGCSFPSKALAGVGVIFYIMVLTRRALRDTGWFEKHELTPTNMAQFLDLVALGTVADVVPLDRNNRILIAQGLKRIRAGGTRPGILALIESAGRVPARLTARDLGFAVGPRLNAAGRLDDMSIGIQCLLAPDRKVARSLALALEQLNAARSALDRQMTEEAALLVAALDVGGEQPGLCVYDQAWHQGIVGIVAGRLRERFHRPAIAFAEAGNDELKGSGRSVDGVHLRDALDSIATRYPGLIQKFGGHAMAAGLSIRRRHLERFSKAFAAEIARWVGPEQVQGRALTDGELRPAECALETARLLERYGPWGQHFPEPVFHGEFELVHQRVVGERHLKLSLRRDNRLLDAIAFNQSPLPGRPTRVRAVFRLSENDYQGVVTLQLMVEHLQDCDA